MKSFAKLAPAKTILLFVRACYMRTLYTKLPLLLVLLLITVKQNDLVAITGHTISIQQSIVDKIPSHSGTKVLQPISAGVRVLNNFNSHFSFNQNISPNTSGIAVLFVKNNKPAAIKFALVNSIIKVPLPISHLSSVVAYHVFSDQCIACSDNTCKDNVWCLPTGRDTVIANLA